MKKSFPKLKSKKAFKEFVEKNDLGDYLEAKDLKLANIQLENKSLPIMHPNPSSANVTQGMKKNRCD